ncbi:hypothetical protein [Gemella morbillorum]|uniref:hypothetical protein n=1 Tax=Gemella morbillorum TaxID=29391 RepID=UPI001CB094F2|nr:hypothetical protein [Gemella morbillorum]MBF1213225.1 hypothetical protein [Gemella morbillorum]
MKKNILIILSILIITILSGCQKKEEVSTYEQDRVAQYILDNVELVDGSEIKKIKFLSFKKPNTAAQIWSIDIEINDNIAMNLSENKLGDKLSIIYSDKEVKYISKERERRKIEIIYLKDGKHGR